MSRRGWQRPPGTARHDYTILRDPRLARDLKDGVNRYRPIPARDEEWETPGELAFMTWCAGLAIVVGLAGVIARGLGLIG